ncbi:MAG: FkbM family methyltransferase [Dehalococcoidia bacterium]|nr:MAG: FkbM family methyltransferase [Dehalococcoidia bacterium]
MNIKKQIWQSTNKHNLQLDSLYYYSRIMRILEAEIFIVNALVNRDGTAVDIGANYGVWSYHLSKIFRRVEAFEPIKECCDVIRSTRRKNINVHNEALSSSPGKLELHIPVEKSELLLQSARLGDVGGQFESRVVSVKTLDTYSVGKVLFIKIDVEGHEIEVLKGAERTIRQFKPVMIIEIEQRHLDFPMDEVFKLVESYGYNAFFQSGRKLRPYAQFSYKLDQLPYLDNLSSVAYVHNFIFLPKEQNR